MVKIEYINRHGYEKDQETGLHYAEARYYDSWLSIFNSTDPMWYKYPHLSPYAYCADNPVMFVDPDGRDPIYAKKFWGGVRKIGDDGKCGSGSYLVRGSIARDVKAATRAGEFYSGDLSQGNNVMHIPTGKILDGVQHTVISTLNSGNTPETRVESGGHALISDITARIWDSGTSMKTETLPNGNILKKWGVLPFKIDNKKGQVGGQASTIRFIWHTHPNGDIPSGNKDEGDMYWVYHLKEHGFTGNSFLIDVENNRVTFYNEKGVIMNIHYNDFIKMGKQEDIK